MWVGKPADLGCGEAARRSAESAGFHATRLTSWRPDERLAYMRSRRSVQLLVVASVILTACGGREQAADQPTAAPPASVDATPSTIAGRAPVLPIVTTAAATSAATTATSPAPITTGAATSPALATTLSPTTLPATANATTTRQLVTLPPGVTEADRMAAESAAIGWWEEYYRQIDALPGFDPAAILRKAVEGRPAGPALIDQLAKLESEGLTVRRGKIRRIVLVSTRFVTPTTAEVVVCGADDDAFIYTNTGAVESEGLARLFILNVLERGRNGWSMADYGSTKSSELGKPCD